MAGMKSTESWTVRQHVPAAESLVGLLLIILGVLNALDGIAAIIDADFLTRSPHLMFGTLVAWGAVLVALAAVQVACGVGLMLQVGWARWLAIGLIIVDTFTQMVVMPTYPLWSLVIIAINLLALHALFARYRGVPVETVGPSTPSRPPTPMDSGQIPYPPR